jgi:anti-sigma factor RsiW
MTPSTTDPRLLLHAYVDGELDPANALEAEQQLAADPALAAERERIETLRRVIARLRAPFHIRLGARSPPRSRWPHSSAAARLGLRSPPAPPMPTWSWPITCAR